jgi:hypothetical protein
MPELDALRRTIETAAGGRRPARVTLGVTGPRALVAWIESPDDVATLLVAGQGQILLEHALAQTDITDFGYEGCSARHLSWCGERVVVVTMERGYSFLLSVEPKLGEEELICLSHAWRIHRDLVLWVDHDPGLVCIAALPSLQARPPLPFRGVPASGGIQIHTVYDELSREEAHLQVVRSSHSGGGVIDTLALPTDRQRAEYEPVDDLLDVVEQRLFPVANAPTGARFVIEAVAYPFIRSAPQRNRRSCWPPSPVWMPVYWHRHLVSTGREHEAEQLLDLLDEIALPLPETQPEYGWDPRWSAREGSIELAARYVRRQSRNLAGACRGGGLPQGWYCLLFDPAPQSNVSGSRIDPSGFPPTLRGMFERLAQTRPDALQTGKG